MAAPKKSRKSRTSAPKNQYSTELTSGQLVMGLAILMVFGLACFLLGVLIGKFDPTISKPVKFAQQPPAEQSTPLANNDVNKPTPTPPENSTPTMEEKTVTIKRPPKQPVKTANSVPQTAQIVDTTTPPKKDPSPPKPEPKTTVTKPPKPPAPTPAVAPKRGWSVQAGAFKIISNAEREKGRIQPAIPHTIEIVRPPGSIYYKLLIGSYSTKAEAEKLKSELATKNPTLGFGLSKPI